MKKALFIFLYWSSLAANQSLIDPSPVHMMMNPCPAQSLVNSVDFHPTKNQCCVTLTHNQRVIILNLDEENGLTIFQELFHPVSQLGHPQHAVYSPDGQSLVVANWSSQTFTIYHADVHGYFDESPAAIIPYPEELKHHRPHGIAFSSTGEYLAVAFGASTLHPRGVALFAANHLENLTLLDLLESDEVYEGIPKGVAFSPDDSCLVVTLSATNAVALYTLDWTNHAILSPPRQLLKGASTGISRPEDIKFTRDGNHCAVTNSSNDTITFYDYDDQSIVGETPAFTLKNPEGRLSFPHGITFSPDGEYLLVTQFGPVQFDRNSNLHSWGNVRRDCVAVYKMNLN